MATPPVSDSVQLDGQKRSIEHLEELYTVVAALAVALAGERFAGAITGGHWVPAAPLVVAFSVTLIPFAHGTLLHLDKVYRRNDQVHDYNRLLVDYTFLLLEAGALVLAGIYIDRTRPFTLVLSILLLVDIMWAAIIKSRFAADPTTERWSIINTWCLPFVLICAGLTWTSVPTSAIAIGVCVVAVIRTGRDYLSEPAFYRGEQSVPDDS